MGRFDTLSEYALPTYLFTKLSSHSSRREAKKCCWA